jgi:hypothetical protein
MDIITFCCAMNVASCPHLLPLLCLPTSCDNYHCWRFRVYTSNDDNLNVNRLFQFLWFTIIRSTSPFYFFHTPSPYSIFFIHHLLLHLLYMYFIYILHFQFAFCVLVSFAPFASLFHGNFFFFFHMSYKLSTTILMFFAIVSL